MMPDARPHLYYADLLVLVPVTVAVKAADDGEAFGRAVEGAWHSVIKPDWDRAQVQGIMESATPAVRRGPGVQGA
jgi:hypothetical protein